MTETRVDIVEGLQKRRVAHNTVIYLAAQLLSWAVTFISVSIIPRRLGETAMGQIATASAATGVVMQAGMLSIETFLTMEVGRDRRQTEHLLRATLGLRILMCIPMTIGSLLVLWSIKPAPIIWALGFASIFGAYVGYLSEPMRSVLAGWEEARRVSILDLVLTCAPLWSIPFLMHGPMAIAVATLIFTVIVFIFRLRWVSKTVNTRPIFRWRDWLEVIKGGLPFVANELVLTFYGFSSVIILRWYTGDAWVGVFSQSQRLFGTLLFVPTALSYALMPQLARIAFTNPSEFKLIQPRVLTLLIVLGLPVTVLTIMLAEPFCRLLYGATRPSPLGVPVFTRDLPPVLKMYALNVIPCYIVIVMNRFLVAQRKTHIWTAFISGTVVISAIFTAILVPVTMRTMKNGAVGAVAAIIIAELCSMVSAFVLLRTNPLTKETVNRILRAMVATAGMMAAVWLLRNTFVLIPAFVGISVFMALVTALKALGEEEQAKLTSMIREKLDRRSG